MLEALISVNIKFNAECSDIYLNKLKKLLINKNRVEAIKKVLKENVYFIISIITKINSIG